MKQRRRRRRTAAITVIARHSLNHRKGEATMRAIIAATTIAAAVVTSTADAAPKQPRPVRPVSFYAEATFGETVRVLRHGPIKLSLRCFAATAPSGLDVAELVVSATVPDWLNTGEQEVLGQPANDVRLLFWASTPPDRGGYFAADKDVSALLSPGSTQELPYDFEGVGGSVITPNGWALSVPADAVGFGIAAYRLLPSGPAWEDAPDCFVTGFAFQARLAP